MKKIYLAICICTLLLLNSCGFQLRGTYNIPTKLHNIYLQSTYPYSDFSNNLRQELRDSHVNISTDPFAAPITLYIQGENFTTAQTSVGNSNNMRQYLARFSISYSLQNSSGKLLYGPRTISTTETIYLVANEELQSSDKLISTKQQMIQNTINELMHQLSSQDVAKYF